MCFSAFPCGSTALTADRCNQILVKATARKHDIEQDPRRDVYCTQLLQFVAGRIRNEAINNRAAILNILMPAQSMRQSYALLGAPVVVSGGQPAPPVYAEADSVGQPDIWLELLDDLLQAPDLDQLSADALDQLMQAFRRLAERAIRETLQAVAASSRAAWADDGSGDPSTGLTLSAIKRWVGFGVELKWRLAVHMHGPKQAAREFVLPVDFVADAESTGTQAQATAAATVEADRVLVVEQTIGLLHTLVTAKTGEPDLGHFGAAGATAFEPEGEGEGEAGGDDAAVLVSHTSRASRSTGASSGSGGGRAKLLQQQLRQWSVYFELAQKRYTKIPLLVSKLEAFANLAGNGGGISHHSLSALDDLIGSQVRGYHTKKDPWQKRPVFVKYYEDVLRAYGTTGPLGEAPYEDWLSSQLLPNKKAQKQAATAGHTRPERQRAKAATVLKLLAMSDSAIHLKLVWRFLCRHRQDLLTEKFVDPEGELDGTFHRSARARAAAGDGQSSDSDDDGGGGMFDGDEDEDEDEIPPPFMLPATYGLHRLRQADAAKLAARWKAQACDEELSTAERARAAVRYCQSPATFFGDTLQMARDMWEKEASLEASKKEWVEKESVAKVAYADAKESRDEVAAARAKEDIEQASAAKAEAARAARLAAPVLVVETLLQGTLKNDESMPPFRYLLEPYILERAEARVTMQAVSAATLLVSSADIAKFVRAMLGNQARRRQIKVSVHKSLLRLLKFSSEEGPVMVLREWGRKGLHRDIRVEILDSAIGMLQVPKNPKQLLCTLHTLCTVPTTTTYGCLLTLLTVIAIHPSCVRSWCLPACLPACLACRARPPTRTATSRRTRPRSGKCWPPPPPTPRSSRRSR
eukprot:SAG22_NODE_85_length_21510_cov_6.472187_9_plen_866_part_00